MKNWIAVLSILILQGCFSLPDPKLVTIPTVEPAGSITDTRDGHDYPLVKVGDDIWITTNLKYAAPGSMCLLNDDANCETYGRHYTLNEALTACPAGFKVPSTVDFKNFWEGLGIEDPDVSFYLKFPTLITDYFSWKASGFYHSTDDEFYRKDVDGIFLTRTNVDANNTNVYIWHSKSGTLEKTSGGLSFRFSCLCIKEN